MVQDSSSKYQPAEYSIGSQVFVRRFSSKSHKKAGNKAASKTSRIIKGTIVERNAKKGTYYVRYTLDEHTVEEWYNVSDLTSMSLDEEKKLHMNASLSYPSPSKVSTLEVYTVPNQTSSKIILFI